MLTLSLKLKRSLLQVAPWILFSFTLALTRTPLAFTLIGTLTFLLAYFLNKRGLYLSFILLFLFGLTLAPEHRLKESLLLYTLSIELLIAYLAFEEITEDEKVKELEEELTKLKEELETRKLDCITLQKEVAEKEALLKSKQFAQEEGAYNQLRSQFEEKNQVLAETRKDLFAKETELLSLKQTIHLEADEEKERLLTLEREMEELKQEVSTLEEIIDHYLASDSQKIKSEDA